MKATDLFVRALEGVECIFGVPGEENLNLLNSLRIPGVQGEPPEEEYLSKLILFGEASLKRALRHYLEHYHSERTHQGKGNVLLFPEAAEASLPKPVQCRERLGGLLRYYHREAA